MVEFDDEQLHLSPVHKRLGMSVVDFKPGFVVLSMPLSDEVRGVYEGTIHGGCSLPSRTSPAPPASGDATTFLPSSS
jgi:hypothetical protein